MKRQQPEEVTLPVGTNPVARQVGRLMRLFRESRGWDVTQAAASLGISGGQYYYLEAGRLVPGPAMSRRLRQWMIDKIDFTGAPPVSEKHWATDAGAKKWRKVSALLTMKDAARLSSRAKTLGMSVRDLAATYILMGLEARWRSRNLRRLSSL